MYLISIKIVPFTLFRDGLPLEYIILLPCLEIDNRKPENSSANISGMVWVSDFDNESRFAYYRIFSVGNKKSGYKLTIGEYEGNAGKQLHDLFRQIK